MLPAYLSERAVRSRLVTVGTDLEVTVDDDSTPYFACSLREPDEAPTDGAPRDRPAAQMSFLDGPDLTVGSRVNFWQGEEWEIVEGPAMVRTGFTLVGYRAFVLPVADLWPRTAALTKLGDEDPLEGGEEVPCAIWQPSERDTDRGSYGDYLGEVPIEFAALIVDNVDFILGEEAFRIAKSSTDYETPRVSLELTRRG